MLKRFATGVAGESFQNPDGVSRQALIRLCEEGDPVRLVREPGNGKDENAIQVISRLGVIGYIKSDVAERLSRDIDRGKIAKADILSISLVEEVELYGVVIEVSVYETI